MPPGERDEVLPIFWMRIKSSFSEGDEQLIENMMRCLLVRRVAKGFVDVVEQTDENAVLDIHELARANDASPVAP